MTNLTITVDEDTLKRARIRAIQDGTSVSVVLRNYLEAWARASSDEAGREFVAIARRASGGSGERGRRWTRDELHDR